MNDQTPPSDEQRPAGWYPDPSGRSPLRWWDGSAWTDVTKGDQLAPAAKTRGPVAELREWWNQQGWWKWPAAGFAALVLLSAVTGSSEDENGGGNSGEDRAGSQPSAAKRPDKITKGSIEKDGH